MRRHLENLKQQPEHVRHRVALTTSAGLTGLVAVVWLTTLAASGSLALSGPASAEADLNLEEARTGFESLVGAVGEARDALGSAPSGEPELTIVDGGTTTTIAPPTHQNGGSATVIPF